MPSWDVHFKTRVDTKNQEVVSLVAKAQALASVIRSIPITPGAQERIDALNIMRAVHGTTGIEGTQLTEDEVYEIMKTPPGKEVLPPSRKRDELEARNAAEVMEFVVHHLTKQPDAILSEQLISTIHEITTKDIDYPNNVPGKYRNHPVSAGTYLPPRTGDEVARLMEEFIDWFNNGEPKSWDTIIRAIVAHFYILSIHPFGDGNGRTARGVESFLLYKAGVNARGFYSLANFYYKYRPEYVQLLDEVRFKTNGNLTPFVLFSLRGLAGELEEVHNAVIEEVKLISFRDFAREALEDKIHTSAGERMFNLLLGLGKEPVSMKDLRAGKHYLAYLYRKLSSKTLSRDINLLKQRGLIVVEDDKLKANIDVMVKFTPTGYAKRTRRRRRKVSTKLRKS